MVLQQYWCELRESGDVIKVVCDIIPVELDRTAEEMPETPSKEMKRLFYELQNKYKWFTDEDDPRRKNAWTQPIFDLLDKILDLTNPGSEVPAPGSEVPPPAALVPREVPLPQSPMLSPAKSQFPSDITFHTRQSVLTGFSPVRTIVRPQLKDAFEEFSDDDDESDVRLNQRSPSPPSPPSEAEASDPIVPTVLYPILVGVALVGIAYFIDDSTR